ncbi:DUF885 family protein, partial [Algibacter mikhailovii]|uniref:DUF885 family protein n=2 Tax=Algibacter mikhailovii TaxID=425498 RepID=UPI00167B18E8
MKYTVIVLICGLLLACSKNQNNINTITNLNLLADSYLKAFLSTHPEDAYSYGIDIERHDGHPMNDVNEILEWQNYEDSLYSEFQKIDQSKITLAKDKITYWTLKEKLESQIEFRICKQYLWQISHMTGWQNTWLNMARKQPVITESNKSQVLIRWNYFPRFIDNEITNLKSGIEQGYTMPKEIVAVVIDQIQTILEYPIDKSPLIAPAKRATSKTFKDDWTILIQERVLPAIHVYQNYLKEEYYDQAREEVSIVNIPNGSECYQAYIRYWTSTEMTADEIHELGLKVVGQNKAEVIELGQNIYQTSDFTEVIKKSKSDSTQYFKNSGDMLTYNEQFLKTAKLECANWFSSLPSSDVEIYPYEAHEKGSARYEMATSNTPAYFRINLNHPNSEIFGQSEIRNAHEAYPGHHLQIG